MNYFKISSEDYSKILNMFKDREEKVLKVIDDLLGDGDERGINALLDVQKYKIHTESELFTLKKNEEDMEKQKELKEAEEKEKEEAEVEEDEEESSDDE